MDAAALHAWIGRQEIRYDDITPTQAQALAATLDWENTTLTTGQILPAPWHWLYFLPIPKASEIDVDGHARKGGFLPAVPLPRRMWAGSRITFQSPLRIGDSTRRVSTIKDVKSKEGSSGYLVFVTVLHETFVIEDDLKAERLAICEEQDIVYREALDPGAPLPQALPSPAQAQWSQEIRVDPVLLFRFSALTFNAHRIHYDRNYAVENEGYEGLVVQGPLTATLLLDLLRKNLPDVTVKSFAFRGIRPLTDTGSLRVEGSRDGDNVLLWALDATGALAMKAQATLG